MSCAGVTGLLVLTALNTSHSVLHPPSDHAHLRCSFRGFDFCSWSYDLPVTPCRKSLCSDVLTGDTSLSHTLCSFLFVVAVLYQSSAPSQATGCCIGIHSRYLVHNVAFSLFLFVCFFTEHPHTLYTCIIQTNTYIYIYIIIINLKQQWIHK